MNWNVHRLVTIAGFVAAVAPSATGFEGRIEIVTTRGDQATGLLYTVGKEQLRIETVGTERPDPIDVVELVSGELTLIYPHNRSFMRMKAGSNVRGTEAAGGLPGAPAISPAMPAMPAMPSPPGGLPAGVGPQNPGVPSAGPPTGAGSLPARPMPLMPVMPSMPSMPMAMPIPMPMSMGEKIELKPTGKKEIILGFPCEQFEITSRGETLEIWTTDKLLPFRPYVRNQSPRFGPVMLEEQWPALLTAKKLFPLRVSLHSDGGTVQPLFEVKSIKAGKVEDKEGKLFKPPSDYVEIQPLPF